LTLLAVELLVGSVHVARPARLRRVLRGHVGEYVDAAEGSDDLSDHCLHRLIAAGVRRDRRDGLAGLGLNLSRGLL
jgi:hypothetical protein